ncbi:MAG: hypothetical protein R6V08_11030 [Desulfuromonadales bacterium]
MAEERSVRIKVESEVARIVRDGAPREQQLRAARGELGLSDDKLLKALLFLSQKKDREIRAAALKTARELPAQRIAAVIARAQTHYQILDFIARVRSCDSEVISSLLDNPEVAEKTLLFLAERGCAEVVDLLLEKIPSLKDSAAGERALAANPNMLEMTPPEEQEGEEEHKSKYQLSLEMKVSEKIGMAAKGDKEWRSLLIKDANKVVSSAVLKNPRISEAEILALANNKMATDEQIRIILLNKEWIKKYPIKKALIVHPRTPLPKALRFLSVLTEKDLKALAKSRGVAQVIVTQARRMLVQKQSKR